MIIIEDYVVRPYFTTEIAGLQALQRSRESWFGLVGVMFSHKVPIHPEPLIPGPLTPSLKTRHPQKPWSAQVVRPTVNGHKACTIHNSPHHTQKTIAYNASST